MGIRIKKIIIDNFKSYDKKTEISISDLSVLMGANSSGKSTALQTLLAIKQTMECNSPDIDLLLSGKYVTLGDFDDVINDATRDDISFGLIIDGEDRRENYGDDSIEVMWHFSKGKDIVLSNMVFVISDNKICLRPDVEQHIYSVYVNDEKTSISIELHNLIRSKIFLNYNKEFNNIFYSFLNELYKSFFPGKKTVSFVRNKMIPYNIFDRLYFEIVLLHQDKNIDLRTITEDVRKTASSLKLLLEKYSNYQNKSFINDANISPEWQINLLAVMIQELRIQEEITDIINCYKEKYNKCIEKYDKNNVMYDEKTELQKFDTNEFGNIPWKDSIIEILMLYDELVNEIFGKIFYLGPIREKPQGLYNIGFETIPKYVGTTGAYFASVLLREDKERNFVLPNNEIEHMSLTDALDIWASHLNVANEINVEKNNSFGFSVSIEDTQSRKSDIMNVGIGTSQVIPVLISGLLSDIGEVLIFEQPELHLHPFSQSRLADFFVALVKNGRKVIIETHSEYFLLRMRYQVLMENIKEQDVVVDFFQNKDGTQVSLGKLTGYGGFEYPDDFRDETQQLLDDLMNATFLKRKKHDKCND